MSEENTSHEFRLKNIDETRSYFVKEINQNELMWKKHKKVCRVLNYLEHLLILISSVTGCFSISAFTSLVCIPIGLTSFAVGLKICVITAGIAARSHLLRKRKRNMIK